MNKERKISAKNIIIGILLVIYGGASVYALYGITSGFLHGVVVVGLGLGGIVLPFLTITIFESINESNGSSKYMYTVFLACYSIPILIMGVYHIKLNMINTTEYVFENDQAIEYKIHIDYQIDDLADKDSHWSISLKDDDNNRYYEDTSYEIDKYDIVSYILNINCSSHSIEDRDYPDANLNGTTVQRRITVFADDSFMKEHVSVGNMRLYDKEGNEIIVNLSVRFERIMTPWKVLSTKLIRPEDNLRMLDVINHVCPNANEYTSHYEGNEEIGDGIILVSNDDEREIVVFSELLEKPIWTEYGIDDEGYYSYASMVAYDFKDESEMQEYYDKLLECLQLKYGQNEDDLKGELVWCHMNDKFIVGLDTSYNEELVEYMVDCFVADTTREKEQGESADITREVEQNESTDITTKRDETWGELKANNGGELVYDTLSDSEQASVDYPPFDKNKVYWTPNGKSYHAVDWCYTLENSKTILSGTLEEAKNAGKNDPCSKCVGE